MVDGLAHYAEKVGDTQHLLKEQYVENSTYCDIFEHSVLIKSPAGIVWKLGSLILKRQPV